jgi:uncharacterized protein YacL
LTGSDSHAIILMIYFRIYSQGALIMKSELIFRVLGMAVFAIAGGYLGDGLSVYNPENQLVYTVTFVLIGAFFGLILTPYLTVRPIRALRAYMGHLPAETLVSALIGLAIGLLTAALLAYPLSLLPQPLGKILPVVGVIFFGYFGVTIFTSRKADIATLLSGLSIKREEGTSAAGGGLSRTILLDTSVIIDGRVADIAKTGFLPGTLLIPRFVLNELQYIADSSDNMRRARGRRGMEVLSELQKASSVVVRISDIDVEGVREVDDKLVILARQLKCPILTNDYNLNRIAELQGVSILNINELANAVKSVVLPGEALTISIIQEGKEASQGVGYMDDGTMVVIESGNKLIGQTKNVTVTKVLQTAAGRMIFAKPED